MVSSATACSVSAERVEIHSEIFAESPSTISGSEGSEMLLPLGAMDGWGTRAISLAWALWSPQSGERLQRRSGWHRWSATRGGPWSGTLEVTTLLATTSERRIRSAPAELGGAPVCLDSLDLLEHLWRRLTAASLAILLILLARVALRRKCKDAIRHHVSQVHLAG